MDVSKLICNPLSLNPRLLVSLFHDLQLSIIIQATALRLQQEKISREKQLDEATWRFDHGEAPNEDAVKDLNRTERKRLAMAEAAMRREEELQLAQPDGMMLKTAAEPRPTAYVPDDLGIPKPYGLLAPFKPTELGSTMRQHIRPPQPKPIEI